MARTILEIYDALVLEKEGNPNLSSLQPSIDSSQTLLQDLTSTSKVAIWRLLFFVVAVGIWVFEKILDQHTAEIEALKETLVTGTDLWYSEQSLKFQIGDTLVWNGSNYSYTTTDTDLQIVKFASAITENNVLQLKVAKDDGTGVPEPLDVSELAAFTAYIDSLIFAGTQRNIISSASDLLHLEANIIYNPLVLASDGSLITDPLTFPVEDAINNYIFTLDFNGIFRIQDLVDAIQTVNGVTNVIPTLVETKPDGGVYSDILNSTRQEYIATAGYMKIDGSYPLASNLTYIIK